MLYGLSVIESQIYAVGSGPKRALVVFYSGVTYGLCPTASIRSREKVREKKRTNDNAARVFIYSAGPSTWCLFSSPKAS